MEETLRTRDAVSTGATWDAMMAAAQSGDMIAYHRLLLESSAWLRRYFNRRLPPSMVDDAVQETLIAVHQKRHTYDPERPFGAWLTAIARYKWIDALRGLKARPTEALDTDIAVEDHGDAVVIATSLESLLRTLKPGQTDVIRLVKLQGFSIEEAATMTGQSIPLVKANIHRGIQRLISLLEKHPDAD